MGSYSMISLLIKFVLVIWTLVGLLGLAILGALLLFCWFARFRVIKRKQQ